MKYYIKEYDIIISLDDWRKIRRCSDLIEDVTVFCIEISYNVIGVHGLLTQDMYYWKDKEDRDKVFNEINSILS